MWRAIGSEGASPGSGGTPQVLNEQLAEIGGSGWLPMRQPDPPRERHLSNFDYAKAKLTVHISGKLDCANTPLPDSKSMALRFLHRMTSESAEVCGNAASNAPRNILARSARFPNCMYLPALKKSFDPRKTISPRASIEITAPPEADDAI